MNNFSSYCGLTDLRMRASDTDLPVPFSSIMVLQKGGVLNLRFLSFDRLIILLHLIKIRQYDKKDFVDVLIILEHLINIRPNHKKILLNFQERRKSIDVSASKLENVETPIFTPFYNCFLEWERNIFFSTEANKKLINIIFLLIISCTNCIHTYSALAQTSTLGSFFF